MTDTATLLAMPLEELRERVELAERMALAARLTPSGAYDAPAAPVNSGEAAQASGTGTTRKRRTKAEIDADEAAKANQTGGTTTTTTTGSGPTADELMASMESGPTEATGGGELSLDDIGGGDADMLAGFETDLTPAEYREKANAIIADIQAKKDTARLAVAREALVKVGAQKASEVGDDKIKDFYDALPK